MHFKDLKRNLDKDFSGLPVRRIAVLGDTATQFLAVALRGHGYGEGINFEIFEADYDQLDRQIADPDSVLYRSNPEFVVLYVSSEKLWKRFVALDLADRPVFADRVLEEVTNWWRTIERRSNAKVIQFNFVEFDDGVFGQYATRESSSFLFQLRKLNFKLMEIVQQHGQVFIADVAALVNAAGYTNVHDPRLYVTSKVAFSLDFLPAVAKAVVDIVKAISGNIRKCLILDLDNTLWGGVIGDDGIENIQIGVLGMGHAFDALQAWASELRHRGIILAVCSKNEEQTAKRPFREHPEMTLKLEDIAIFVANWDNKADNIRSIQASLNIGFDSMVFIDDNPFERNLVREHLPAVTVPELPEDPAMYVSFLRRLNLFETASHSKDDADRTQQYQKEIAREEAYKSFTNIDDYLKSLEMASEVKAFDDFNTPRIAQLTQRSNQFNVRTVRYTEKDIKDMIVSDEFITLSFTLEDRFGDHGLIALVILKRIAARVAFVDTWIMSCRVLKRGMEEFTVNQMAAHARTAGLERIVGEFLPTAKNGIVKDLFPRMGFSPVNGQWELDLLARGDLKTFVRPKHEFSLDARLLRTTSC
jgi:FkbH-like protein